MPLLLHRRMVSGAEGAFEVGGFNDGYRGVWIAPDMVDSRINGLHVTRRRRFRSCCGWDGRRRGGGGSADSADSRNASAAGAKRVAHDEAEKPHADPEPRGG